MFEMFNVPFAKAQKRIFLVLIQDISQLILVIRSCWPGEIIICLSLTCIILVGLRILPKIISA